MSSASQSTRPAPSESQPISCIEGATSPLARAALDNGVDFADVDAYLRSGRKHREITL